MRRPVPASSAMHSFGAVTYMMLSTTTGVTCSWPASGIENIHAGASRGDVELVDLRERREAIAAGLAVVGRPVDARGHAAYHSPALRSRCTRPSSRAQLQIVQAFAEDAAGERTVVGGRDGLAHDWRVGARGVRSSAGSRSDRSARRPRSRSAACPWSEGRRGRASSSCSRSSGGSRRRWRAPSRRRCRRRRGTARSAIRGLLALVDALRRQDGHEREHGEGRELDTHGRASGMISDRGAFAGPGSHL